MNDLLQLPSVADLADKLTMVNMIRRNKWRKQSATYLTSWHFGKGINFEACYHVGPFSEEHTRPVLVSFDKQADRDLVNAKRLDLKRTRDFQWVWINEDLGSASKRKRDIIRLITKQAHMQGIDCKTGSTIST